MKCHNPYCFNQLIKRQKKYCSTICCTSDPNYKKSMSNKLIGRIFSDEHKKNKSLAQTGKKNHRYGKHISETNRQKVSLLLLNNKHALWHSSAERKRIDIEKNKIATNNGFLLYRFDVTNISKISKVIEQNYYVLQSMFI